MPSFHLMFTLCFGSVASVVGGTGKEVEELNRSALGLQVSSIPAFEILINFMH